MNNGSRSGSEYQVQQPLRAAGKELHKNQDKNDNTVAETMRMQ
jgi:hypothetical protein